MSEEVKGLDAHIDAALAGVDGATETETPVAATETIAAPAEDVSAPVDEAPTDGARVRDEKGRFAPKDSPLKAPDETPVAAAVESTEPTIDPKPVEAAKAAWTDGHFRGWAPERRQAFEKLPPEAQSVAMDIAKDLQAEFTRKTTEAAKFKEQVEPVLQVLSRESDLFSQQGLNPIQAFQGYAAIERTLTYGNFADKLQLIQTICDRYGVPFAVPQDLDPNAQALHDHQAKFAQERARTTNLERQLQTFQRSQVDTEITAFASAKNADGSPAHPHFDAVKPAMSALLTSGQATSLQHAYELASKPIQDLIDAKAAEARRQVEARQVEAVEKAKRAAPVRSSNNAMPSGKAKASGIDAIISGALDSAGFN